MNFRKITAGIIAFTSAVALSSAVLPDGTSFIGGTDISVSAAQEAYLVSEGEEEDGFEYQLWGYSENKPDFAIITGTSKRNTVTIPEKIAGYPVREIGNSAFYYAKDVTRVIIPSTVEKIGDHAFMYSNITSITVPDSVKTIEAGAFEGCDYLTSATIGTGVEYIGSYAFSNCGAFGSITFKETETPVLKGIGEYTFNNCQSLSAITIPDSVETIGTCAFQSCSALVRCTLPSSLTAIPVALFGSCSSLTGVKIPDKVEVIGENAFVDCTSLISVSIPDSVYSVGSYAFAACNNLSSVKLSNEMNSIMTGTFVDCGKLEKVVLPENIAIVKADAFAGCGSLKSITIPENVQFIERYSIGYPRYEVDYDNRYKDLVIYGVKGSTAERYANDFGFKFNSIAKETLAITAQPASVTKTENETAKFAVTASGSGLKYQWYWRKNANESWAASTGTGAATSALSVTATTARNGYQYYCKITDDSGASVNTNTVTLTVKSALAITSQPASVTKNEGETAKFTVSASGTGLKYQWYWRKTSSDAWAASSGTGSTANSMTVAAEMKRNGYQYYCKITDGSGNTVKSNTVTLTVKSVLAVTSQPKSQTAADGETVKFTAAANGTGLKYQWYWRKNSEGTWAASTGTGAATASLSVTGTAARNGYQYYCKITDANGNSVKTNTVSLTVMTVTSQPKSVTASVNDTVKFTAKSSLTNVTYQWYWKADAAASTWKTSTATGATTATLSVTATGARNGYQYRCVIKDNASGKTVTTDAATLTTVYMALQPKSQTAAKDTTVLFVSAVNAENVTYQWYWRKPNTTEWKESTTNGAKTAVLTVYAADSRNGYQYRCAATDKATGKMYISDIATLTVK